MRLMFGGQRVLSTNIAVILSDAICVELMKMPETKKSGQQARSAKKCLPLASKVNASQKEQTV